MDMSKWPLIAELAAALRVGRNTIYQWKFRQAVPEYRQRQILALARRRKKRLSPKAFGNGAGK